MTRSTAGNHQITFPDDLFSVLLGDDTFALENPVVLDLVRVGVLADRGAGIQRDRRKQPGVRDLVCIHQVGEAGLAASPSHLGPNFGVHFIFSFNHMNSVPPQRGFAKG